MAALRVEYCQSPRGATVHAISRKWAESHILFFSTIFDMHKRQVPLSHMSRGQRMVMLALNKRTKAIASGVSKVEKSVYT